MGLVKNNICRARKIVLAPCRPRRSSSRNWRLLDFREGYLTHEMRLAAPFPAWKRAANAYGDPHCGNGRLLRSASGPSDRI